MINDELQNPQIDMNQKYDSQLIQEINERNQSSLMSFFNVDIIANVEKHTRFLSSLINMNKAFRITIIVRKSNDSEVELDKSYTQTNQSSDINVMFNELIRFLGLQLHSLSKIEFKDLSMRIADHQNTILKH